jgi:hypothetical protein
MDDADAPQIDDDPRGGAVEMVPPRDSAVRPPRKWSRYRFHAPTKTLPKCLRHEGTGSDGPSSLIEKVRKAFDGK